MAGRLGCQGQHIGGGGVDGVELESIDAARAKATVGEISDAMEKVFGRHRAEIKSITGVYKREASTMSNPAADHRSACCPADHSDPAR